MRPAHFPTALAVCAAAAAVAAPRTAPAADIAITLDTDTGTLSYVSDTALQFIGLFLEDADLVGTTCAPPAVAACTTSGSYQDAGSLGVAGVLAGMRAGPLATDLFPATATPLVLLQTNATGISFDHVAAAFGTVVVDVDGFEQMGSTSLDVIPEPGTGALMLLGALGLAVRRRLHASGLRWV